MAARTRKFRDKGKWLMAEAAAEAVVSRKAMVSHLGCRRAKPRRLWARLAKAIKDAGDAGHRCSRAERSAPPRLLPATSLPNARTASPTELRNALIAAPSTPWDLCKTTKQKKSLINSKNLEKNIKKNFFTQTGKGSSAWRRGKMSFSEIPGVG